MQHCVTEGECVSVTALYRYVSVRYRGISHVQTIIVICVGYIVCIGPYDARLCTFPPPLCLQTHTHTTHKHTRRKDQNVLQGQREKLTTFVSTRKNYKHLSNFSHRRWHHLKFYVFSDASPV